MPIRNLFARRPGPIVTQDENQRPGSAAGSADTAHSGFEKVDTVGSKASSAFSIRSRKSQDTGEYKMSVVNDSGVYLPPSPVEKESLWPRRYLSRTSSDRSSTGEIEHFPISRESFDSYRRSFDISAKSPVVAADPVPPRQSLDSSRRPPRVPRSPLSDQRLFEREPPTPEEADFEDVGLNDDPKQEQQQQSQAAATGPRKRGFLAKFGSDSADAGLGGPAAPAHHHLAGQVAGNALSWFPLPGRRRAPSGSQDAAELRVIPPATASRLDKAALPTVALQAQEVGS